MKKLILAIAMLVLTTGISWAEVAQPTLPVSLDKFELAAQGQWDCGTLEFYRYEESENVVWYVVYLNRFRVANALLISRLTLTSREDWLDKNRDGVFDEYYTDYNVFDQKYPSPCDAVK